MKKAFIFLVLAACGCATTQSIKEEYRTRLYEKDIPTVFGAVVKYCNSKGFPIIMADKELGIINTDYITNSGLSKALIGGERGKLYFYIVQANNYVKLTAIITYEQAGAFGSYNQGTMTEGNAVDLYDKLFLAIESNMSAVSIRPASSDTSTSIFQRGSDTPYKGQ